MLTTASAMHGAVRSRPFDEVNMYVGVRGCAAFPKLSHKANSTRKKKPTTSGAMTCASLDGN